MRANISEFLFQKTINVKTPFLQLSHKNKVKIICFCKVVQKNTLRHTL